MKKKYTLLITSCDNFSDTWQPLFTLFNKYWKDTSLEIMLITEKLKYCNKDFIVESTQISRDTNKRFTWSETLIESIKCIENDIILLYMDDFFLQSEVAIDKIDKYANYMLENEKIDVIYLHEKGPENCINDDKYENLLRVKKTSSYKVSMMAGLWRKSVLLNLLHAEENAWMFELYGTKRAKKLDLLMYRVSDSNSAPLNYIYTGIIKGKWNPEVVDLFSDNNIILDYKLRGFYKSKRKIYNKLLTLNKLLRDPIRFCKYYLNF